MAAPASDELRELARELTIAAESGETLSLERMREDFGLGHDDLMKALDTLREHGQAVEAAPGEWRGPLMDEMAALPTGEPAPGPVTVSVPDSEPGDDFDAAGEAGPRRGGGVVLYGEANVRLTRAIADALEPDALGQIVKAGLAGAAEDEPFTLEVLP